MLTAGGDESGPQPIPGPLAEPVSAATQHAADPVERVAGVSTPVKGLLLDALADQVELGPGKGDNMKRVHDRDCIRNYFGGGGFVAGEAIHRHHLHPCCEVSRLGGQPGRKGGR